MENLRTKLEKARWGFLLELCRLRRYGRDASSSLLVQQLCDAGLIYAREVNDPDSNRLIWIFDGLTPLGREIVRERQEAAAEFNSRRDRLVSLSAGSTLPLQLSPAKLKDHSVALNTALKASARKLDSFEVPVFLLPKLR